MTGAEGTDARLVAKLLAVDPHGLGGAVVRDPAGDALVLWLAEMARLSDPAHPIKRMPAHIAEDRLLGGLDLAATLAAGRRVVARGLLAEADGGFIVVGGAERLPALTVAHLARALDDGVVTVERDGVSHREGAHFGVVAADESRDGDEPVAAALADRLAFSLGLDARALASESPGDDVDRAAVAAARDRLARITVPDDVIEALCGAAVHLGIGSLRPSLLAVKAARAIGALAGRERVIDRDAEIASRLVLAPRVSLPPDLVSEPPPPSADPPDQPDDGDTSADDQRPISLDEIVLAAALANVPSHLIDSLKAGGQLKAGRGSGRRAAEQKSPRHGRPVGVRRETRRSAQRLDLVATLKAAAPWQRLRRGTAVEGPERGRLQIRRDDFHIKRLKRAPVSVAIFVVDASGSSALHRLAEAKGAVELLLRDCYVRRDEVALISFRGKTASLVLPPTRSLVRARRHLAELPGGGGTPLAAGLAAAADLAARVRRKGHLPVVVVLTDGRANVTLAGEAGRDQARDDALTVARRLAADGHATLVIDTSPRPDPQAQHLAEVLGARYLPLPYAGAEAVSAAVRHTVAGAHT